MQSLGHPEEVLLWLLECTWCNTHTLQYAHTSIRQYSFVVHFSYLLLDLYEFSIDLHWCASLLHFNICPNYCYLVSTQVIFCNENRWSQTLEVRTTKHRSKLVYCFTSLLIVAFRIVFDELTPTVLILIAARRFLPLSKFPNALTSTPLKFSFSLPCSFQIASSRQNFMQSHPDLQFCFWGLGTFQECLQTWK